MISFSVRLATISIGIVAKKSGGKFMAENGGLEPQAFDSSLCFQNSDARPNASLSAILFEFCIYFFHQIVEQWRGIVCLVRKNIGDVIVSFKGFDFKHSL